MFKVVWFARFPAWMLKEDARRYWAEHHGPLAAATAIERYVQNHVVGPLDEQGAVGFDGFSECWFRDEAQFTRAISSDAWARAVVDGDHFIDMTQLWGAVVNERLVKGEREFAAV